MQSRLDATQLPHFFFRNEGRVVRCGEVSNGDKVTHFKIYLFVSFIKLSLLSQSNPVGGITCHSLYVILLNLYSYLNSNRLQEY